MNFFFGGVFWGIFFIVLGLCAIFKTVFQINLSLFRIGIALIIIYMGFSILFGGSHFQVDQQTVLFDQRDLILTRTGEEYNVIFGQSVIDLTTIPHEEPTHLTKINIVFGKGTIKLNPEQPVKIKVTSALAGAKMPDGNQIAMGEYIYCTPSFSEDPPGGLVVEANVVFGSLEFVN